MSYQRGDVVWGPDPFKSGENPRPWLILNNDTHPFGEEEYMTVTLTTTPHDEGIPLEDTNWVEGGMPRQSYASPWQSRRRSTPRLFDDRAASTSRSSRPSSTHSKRISNHRPRNDRSHDRVRRLGTNWQSRARIRRQNL